MQPDPTYKRIFAHEFMVEELMRWFVADLHGARELVDALDFRRMLRLQEQSVTGDAETPRRYADDMVWRVRFRGPPEGEGDDSWLYLVLLLEFQAEVAFMMPLRIRNYVDTSMEQTPPGAPATGGGCCMVDERGRATGGAERRRQWGNLYMEQWRGKEFRSTSRLLPVLPIVIYNGSSPWSAAPRVIDLVTPGASGLVRADVASRADPLFSGDGYLLLDTHRVGADDSRMDNAAALLAALENPSPERIAAQLAALHRRLAAPELEPLRELMLLWALRVAEQRIDLDFGMEDMAQTDRLQESGELEAFYAARARAWQDKYRDEGRARGIEEGIAAERNLLLRQAARKFDAGTSDRLASLLSRIDDPEDLAEVGDRIIECASGDDLIARASEIADSDS